MKKLGVLIVVLLVLMTISGCSKKEEEKKTIPTYDADIVCTSNIEDEHDGDVENYISNVFIKLDDSKNVTETIYQSISESTLLDKATLELTNHEIRVTMIDGEVSTNFNLNNNNLIIDNLNTIVENVGKRIENPNTSDKIRMISILLFMSLFIVIIIKTKKV